jgi:hypothetical protein
VAEDKYPHRVTILWGECPEPGDRAKTYRFATKAELDAFMLGVAEMDGWAGYREAEEGYVVPDENDDEGQDRESYSDDQDRESYTA